MNDRPSHPDTRRPESVLPDELLLDLVEGTLRSADVDRVRAALKDDPRLARRLEAMRADRRVIASMNDRGASPAPAGLVADALGSVERDQLLGLSTNGRSRVKRAPRLAPLLVAASLALVAGAGWFAYDAGLLTGDAEDTDRLAGPGAVVVPEGGTTEAARPFDPQDVIRTQEQYEEQFRHELLADQVDDVLQAESNPFDEPTARAPSERLVGVGAPVDVDSVLPTGALPEEARSADPTAMADLTDVVQRVQEANRPESVARAIPPEAAVPDEAAAWARAGLLTITVASMDEEPSDGFEGRIAQRLRIAYDTTLATGWGITSAPTVPTTEMAALNGPGTPNAPGLPGVPGVASADASSWAHAGADRPLVASFKVPADADDEAILSAIRTMASGVRTLTGQRVVLTRLDEPRADARQPGAAALTIDNLLWWRLPADRWTPMSVYHVPVHATSDAPAEPAPDDTD